MSSQWEFCLLSTKPFQVAAAASRVPGRRGPDLQAVSQPDNKQTDQWWRQCNSDDVSSANMAGDSGQFVLASGGQSAVTQLSVVSPTDDALCRIHGRCPIHTATPTRFNCRVESRRRCVFTEDTGVGLGQPGEAAMGLFVCPVHIVTNKCRRNRFSAMDIKWIPFTAYCFSHRYYYYESRTQGTQSAYIRQNSTEKRLPALIRPTWLFLGFYVHRFFRWFICHFLFVSVR